MAPKAVPLHFPPLLRSLTLHLQCYRPSAALQRVIDAVARLRDWEEEVDLAVQFD